MGGMGVEGFPGAGSFGDGGGGGFDPEWLKQMQAMAAARNAERAPPPPPPQPPIDPEMLAQMQAIAAAKNAERMSPPGPPAPIGAPPPGALPPGLASKMGETGRAILYPDIGNPGDWLAPGGEATPRVDPTRGLTPGAIVQKPGAARPGELAPILSSKPPPTQASQTDLWRPPTATLPSADYQVMSEPPRPPEMPVRSVQTIPQRVEPSSQVSPDPRIYWGPKPNSNIPEVADVGRSRPGAPSVAPSKGVAPPVAEAEEVLPWKPSEKGTPAKIAASPSQDQWKWKPPWSKEYTDKERWQMIGKGLENTGKFYEAEQKHKKEQMALALNAKSTAPPSFTPSLGGYLRWEGSRDYWGRPRGPRMA